MSDNTLSRQSTRCLQANYPFTMCEETTLSDVESDLAGSCELVNKTCLRVTVPFNCTVSK